MLMLINLLIAIFLEKTTKKTTRIPASHPHKPKKMNLQSQMPALMAKAKKKIMRLLTTQEQ